MGSWEKPLNSRRSVSSSFLVFPFRGLSRGLLSRGVQQLPFPQYPSVAYQPPFASCGIPGCRREAITYRTRPALADSGRFMEVFEEQRSPRSRPSSCQSRRWVSFSDTEQEEQIGAASSSGRGGSASSGRWVYKTGVRLDVEE